MNNDASATAFKELIAKAHVCGLQNHSGLDEHSRQLIGIADRAQRMLDREEITSICNQSGTNPKAIISTICAATAYVDRCKQTLLTQQPHLFEKGGALHPSERSEACWRDCWNFLRVAIYAMASDTAQCTDPSGIQAVRQLYVLMSVPAAGMTLALQTLAELITADLLKNEHPHEASRINEAFTHLNDALHKG